MPDRTYRIRIARDRYKFSCAHMTVFPDGSKERLHGHNFYLAVALELRDIAYERMIDFGTIKEEIARLCSEWKEHTLLPGRNPHFEQASDPPAGQLNFTLCGSSYSLPVDDAIVLPIDNVSVEGLASLAAEILLERLRPVLPSGVVEAMEVTVEENPGQGASCRISLAAASA